MDLRSQIQAELDKAELARGRGNEGQARVCARRAAGIAARDYLTRHAQSVRTSSAYDVLNFLIQDPSLAAELRRSAEYLTMRVNEEFKLPADVDLIAVARNLCEALLIA